MSPDAREPEWERIAAWYDAKQGEEGDLWHRELIDPALVRRIGDVTGRDLLDLGCGNGYLARRFQRAGARVTAVDASPAMIGRARARGAGADPGVRYVVAAADRLDALGEARFDLVYANMAVMDIEDAAGAFREVAAHLRAFGRFVASLDHPCFGGDAGATWRVGGPAQGAEVARCVHRYRDRFEDPVAWDLGEGRTATTRAFHRPLGWYADALRSAGLAVTALDEPMPTDAFRARSPLGAAIASVPVHLVLEALRLPGRPPGA